MRFEDLEVWRRSRKLAGTIYQDLKDLKDRGFRDQITRSALSIPSNIAEGFERESRRESTSFLSYAKGSCGELRTQIYVGMDVGYINTVTGEQWLQEAIEISSMLNALIRTRKSFLESGAISKTRGRR